MLIKTLVVFVFGLLLGSFVNAFVWRLKKRKNWVSERSVCTHCGHTLSAIDLIPVVSFVLLGGRCRYCRRKIEDTPLTELGVGVAFALSYVFWPHGFDTAGTIQFAVWLLSLVLLSAMFLYDLKWMLLPNKLTYTLGALSALQLVVLLFFTEDPLKFTFQAIFSCVLGGVIFHVLYLASGGKYIGGGDVKLGYAYGLLLLDPLLPWITLTVASLAGSLIAFGLIISGRAGMKSKLPFGPLLIFGVFIAQLFGNRLWDLIGRMWY